jgi:hypothetical protein
VNIWRIIGEFNLGRIFWYFGNNKERIQGEFMEYIRRTRPTVAKKLNRIEW